MSFSLLNQDDFLTWGIPPPNGQVQYRHQGNSAGCVPGSTVARRWRWALKGLAAHTHTAAESLGGVPLLAGLEESDRGHSKIKMPSYFVCVCEREREREKFAGGINGFKTPGEG